MESFLSDPNGCPSWVVLGEIRYNLILSNASYCIYSKYNENNALFEGYLVVKNTSYYKLNQGRLERLGILIAKNENNCHLAYINLSEAIHGLIELIK